MTRPIEEHALRSAMDDLLIDQPAQPVDRLTAIRRRHTRRRTIQVTGTALTAAVAVVASLLVGGVVGRQAAEPLHRPVPSWALPWPDHRDGSVSQSVLDGAVEAWRYSVDGTSEPMPEPTKVVWYLGQKVADGTLVAAVFEVDSGVAGLGHRLVVGLIPVDQARQYNRYQGKRLPPSWGIHEVAAPPASYDGVIGLNFGASDMRNHVLLLAQHGTFVSWQAPGAGSGMVALDDGFGLFDMQPTRGPVQAVVLPSDHPLDYQPVGVPGAPETRVGQMAEPAHLVGLPRTGSTIGVISGRASLTQFDAVSGASGASGATTVYARCYGPAPIRVAIDDDRDGAGVRIPCDDRQHAVPGPHVENKVRLAGPHGRGHFVTVTTRYDVAWRIAVVIDPAA